MASCFVLVETASGYALLQTSDVEEIGGLLPAVQSSVTDYSRFSTIISLTSFQPFTSAENALDNINHVSENLVHADLKSFLTTNLPKPKKMKKHDQFLGIQNSNLAGAIVEATEIPCRSTEVVNEIIRGVRLHLEKFISKLDGGISTKAQLGLGHSYSRAKVKFNVHKQDNMITQSISLLDQLDKDVNTCAMRVKEWYSWHFPELQKIVPDNVSFANLVSIIGKRSSLLEEPEEEWLPRLTEVTLEDTVSEDIITAAKSSMGFEISDVDLVNLQEFAVRVVSLAKFRLELQTYLFAKVNLVAPNLGALVGEVIAARLIAHAGSLMSLAKCPASTIQILGAEKALFRALKTKGNTPKYGLLFNSGFIGKAQQKNKGRISRYLANKCALASRIDCFTELENEKAELMGLYGAKMRQQVEDRLLFFDTGEKPRKNVDVMREAGELLETKLGKRDKMDLVGSDDEEVKTPKKAKKSKKDKKSEKKSEKKSKKKKKKDA